MLNNSAAQKNICALCGVDNWRSGMLLHRDDSVLEVKLDGQVIEAKVINNIAKVERVRVIYSDLHIACRCTCSKNKSFCSHLVAVLLEVDKLYPQKITCLYSGEGTPKAASWANIANMVCKEVEKGTVEPKTIEVESNTNKSTVKRVAELKDLIQKNTRANLLLSLGNKELTNMEGRWGQVIVNCQINLNGRLYSGTNLKHLIDGNASGSMSMDDFSIREQQLIRFLVGNLNEEKNGFLLKAYDFSDLLTLIAGCQIIKDSANGNIVPRQDVVRLVFDVEIVDNENCRISPKIVTLNNDKISNDNIKIISGRDGYWLGKGEEFWWLSGYFNLPWLRLFLRSETYDLDREDFKILENMISQGDLSAEINYTTKEEIEKVELEITPVIQLSWEKEFIEAQVQFKYGSLLVNSTSPSVVNVPGIGFVKRKKYFEEQVIKQLVDYGFAKTELLDLLCLEKAEDVLNFIDNIQNKLLKQNWSIFYSSNYRRKVHNTGKVILEANPADEGENWFNINYRLIVNQRSTIDWNSAVSAVESNKLIFFSKDKHGGVVQIDRGLAQIIRILNYRLQSVTETTMRFGIYAAIPVFTIFAKNWKKLSAKWQRLAEAITSAENKLPVINNNYSMFSPRQYQLEGVAWMNLLADCGFHGILADEMGLGKTLQTLMIISLRRDKVDRNPSLIVCPTSLVGNWQKEAAKFFPGMRVLIVNTVKKEHLSSIVFDYDLIITSYNLIRIDSEAYSAIKWNYMVLDEAQQIKNHRTANAQACKSISAKYRLALSGTPLENSLFDLWSLFDFLLPGLLGNVEGFKKMYVNENNNEKDMASLIKMIKPFVLRRTKQEVCKQLPPKIEKIVYCDFDVEQRKLYEKVRRSALKQLLLIQENKVSNRLELLTLILRLRQICCDPNLLPENILKEELGTSSVPQSVKLKDAIEIIDEAIMNGHRLLLFSQFTSMLDILKARIEEKGWKYEYLDGSVKNRQDRVDNFNKETSYQLFLLSLKAGGTGLNLTGADMVIHFDQWWNPMVEEQATDRSHRIGQTKTVVSLKLVVRNSIEERILMMQKSKRDLFNKVFSSGVTTSIEEINLDDIAFMLTDDQDQE